MISRPQTDKIVNNFSEVLTGLLTMVKRRERLKQCFNEFGIHFMLIIVEQDENVGASFQCLSSWAVSGETLDSLQWQKITERDSFGFEKRFPTEI